MKRGTEIFWAYDFHDKSIIRIKKRRGKLTLEEIEEILRYEERQRFCGNYAIFLNCSEATMGGNGLYFEEDLKGEVWGCSWTDIDDAGVWLAEPGDRVAKMPYFI